MYHFTIVLLFLLAHSSFNFKNKNSEKIVCLKVYVFLRKFPAKEKERNCNRNLIEKIPSLLMGEYDFSEIKSLKVIKGQ